MFDWLRQKTYEELVLRYRYEYGILEQTLKDPGPDIEEIFETHFQKLVLEYLPKGEKCMRITKGHTNFSDHPEHFYLFETVPDVYKQFAKAKGLKIKAKTYNPGHEFYEKVWYLSL